MKHIVFAVATLLCFSQCTERDFVVNKNPIEADFRSLLKPPENVETDFCRLLKSPENYESKIVETKAIILGFHTFIAYNQNCNENGEVVKLDLTYEQRSQILEKLKSQPKNYSVSYLINNIYADVTMIGKLEKNKENDFATNKLRQKYSFSASEILEVKAPFKEILPHN